MRQLLSLLGPLDKIQIIFFCLVLFVCRDPIRFVPVLGTIAGGMFIPLLLLLI
jgi:hypothetical protein